MLPNVLLLLGILLILILAYHYSRYRMRKAIKEIVGIFRRNNALGGDNAKTKEELGLMPPNFIMRMMRQRDYKPYALQMMVGAEIVQVTLENKYFLSEEKLSSSALQRFAD